MDDGLPGSPIEVTINDENPQIEIIAEITPIGNQFEIGLSALTESTITSYEWILNDNFIESAPAPTIFIDNGPNEVILKCITANGCVASDTIMFDFTLPPLSVNILATPFRIYPNPTLGSIEIASDLNLIRYEVYQLDGKKVYQDDINSKVINLSTLKNGVYLFKAFDLLDRSYSQQLIIN